MSITEFQFLFETDKSLQRMLKLSLDKTRICYKPYNYNLFEVFKEDYEFKNKNWDTISKRSGVQRLLVGFLDFYNISYNLYTKYQEDYDFLLDIQPSWVDCQDDSILQPIIDSIPKDLSKTKRIAMGKEKVKALFKYDKTYPRFLYPAGIGSGVADSQRQTACFQSSAKSQRRRHTNLLLFLRP